MGKQANRAPVLEIDPITFTFVKDVHGNTRGGVRTPAVDVPVSVLSGDPAPGTPSICAVLGTTTPFDETTLRSLYSSAGDYLETTQPLVEALVREGAAHIAVSMGEATGPLPFTSYMAAPALLTREPDVVARFARAVYRTQRWLAGRGADEVARVVAAEYSEVEPSLLEAAIARYQRQDTWARDPLLRRSGYDTLQSILLGGGFIRRAHRYEHLVNTAFAKDAMGAVSG